MAQDDQKQEEQNLKLRESLSNAYASVEGAQRTQTFRALTFEDLCAQQIDRIKGPSTSTRPNELERIDKTYQDLVKAVAAIKALPPQAFRKVNPDRAVNTAK